MVRLRRALCTVVERHQINVIQTHLLQVLDFLVLTLRRPTGPSIFWTIHNYNFTLRADQLQRHKWLLGPKRKAYRLLYRTAARWVDGFIAVSDEVRIALLDQIGPIDDKIAVICNGVDVRRYRRPVDRVAIRRQLGLPEDAHLMALVGTLKRQKGHSYLIEAARDVFPNFPTLHVLFVGDGELAGDLRAQARAAGVDERVHFLGSRGDVPDLLAASDSFVLPSLWEGLPMALIEAMASGLPIIATAVSGTNQVMVPGETGLLVAPGDTAALREAIVALLSEPARAAAMGVSARQRVELSFSAKQQAEAHMAMYRRAVARFTGKQAVLPFGTRP
jgi:glycosyltransferase involved in cell wall biosynthesis